jgi:hypothetical protein
VCRFCWAGEESPATDPLILACKCRGSVGLIHYSCLKNWLSTQRCQRATITDQVTSYYWKKFECEICKASYPYLFKSKDNKLFKLIETPIGGGGEDAGPYILLESQPLDKNTSRMIHLLKIRADGLSEFNIGRGNEAEVRINDISVSRLHAAIRYKEGRGFFLDDLNSKFGTIALAKEPVSLPPNTPVTLQLGRTLLTLQAKEVKISRQVKGRGKSLVMASTPANKQAVPLRDKSSKVHGRPPCSSEFPNVLSGGFPLRYRPRVVAVDLSSPGSTHLPISPESIGQ